MSAIVIVSNGVNTAALINGHFVKSGLEKLSFSADGSNGVSVEMKVPKAQFFDVGDKFEFFKAAERIVGMEIKDLSQVEP